MCENPERRARRPDAGPVFYDSCWVVGRRLKIGWSGFRPRANLLDIFLDKFQLIYSLSGCFRIKCNSPMVIYKSSMCQKVTFVT